MSDQQASTDLPLPYLIDALAQLDEALSRRAREHRELEERSARKALDEGKPADYYADLSERWKDERGELIRAITPLRQLTMELLNAERARLAGRVPADQVPQTHEMLPLLIAAARLRAGGTLDVDALLRH